MVSEHGTGCGLHTTLMSFLCSVKHVSNRFSNFQGTWVGHLGHLGHPGHWVLCFSVKVGGSPESGTSCTFVNLGGHLGPSQWVLSAQTLTLRV